MNSTTGDDLMTETGMSNFQYTIALMIFLVAYGLFEVPSNILLKKLRPSRWIAFLMFSWGALTMGLGGVNSYASVTVVRFLLGVFEAGLFPGLVYYLTFWYKTEERSIRVAFILASATLAGAFGGAIAYGIGHMNKAGGLSAWRWLFIIEGVPSCLSAFLVWFLLPDYPENAKWLTTQERDLAVQRLHIEGSKGHHKAMTWEDAKETLVDWRLWGHYVVYFGISTPFSSLSLFTPSITAGLGYHDLQAQLMTVPPYAVAYGTFSVTTLPTRSLYVANQYSSRLNIDLLVSRPFQRSRSTLSGPGYDRRHRLPRICGSASRRVLVALRVSHCSSFRRIRLYTAAAGLALVQYLQHGFRRPRDRAEYWSWRCSGSDCGSLDLQGERGQGRVSNRPLDQCSFAVYGGSRLRDAEVVLCASQQEHTKIEQRGRGPPLQVLTFCVALIVVLKETYMDLCIYVNRNYLKIFLGFLMKID